jgi:hypothetical protein
MPKDRQMKSKSCLGIESDIIPTRPKRDVKAIHRAMEQLAGVSVACEPLHKGPKKLLSSEKKDIGLSLRELEERRWHVTPKIAEERVLGAGLPYEGRRAGLIYSWSSIFRAEGIDEQIVRIASREVFPALYDDLLDTSEAAQILGFRDASSIRKLVGLGEIKESGYIKFGARGIYRFRPSAIVALQGRKMGRVV